MNAPLDAEQRASLEAALKSVTLDDKYTLERGRAYMSGIQALVRLPMLQQERDKAAGLNTAGFISGYRGSPLGGLDQSLWKAKKHLAGHPRRSRVSSRLTRKRSADFQKNIEQTQRESAAQVEAALVQQQRQLASPANRTGQPYPPNPYYSFAASGCGRPSSV